MFQGAPGIGMLEWVLIGVIALVVVGPKDMPLMFRKAGQFVGRLRAMAADFRSSFDEMARQSELDELRREVEALKRDATSVRDAFQTPAAMFTPAPAAAPADDGTPGGAPGEGAHGETVLDAPAAEGAPAGAGPAAPGVAEPAR